MPKKVGRIGCKLEQFPWGNAEMPETLKDILNGLPRLNESEIEHEKNVFLDGLRR